MVDQDDLDETGVSYLGGPCTGNTTTTGSSKEHPIPARPRSPSSPAALRATSGRGSRRVSLIPGEALESGNASFALAALVQAQSGRESERYELTPTYTSPFLTSPDQGAEHIRHKPRVTKAKTTDEGTAGGVGGGGGGAGEGGAGEAESATANSSPMR